MNGTYESLTHGSKLFPIGLHKTIIPANPSVSKSAKYSILYAHWHSEFEFFYLSRGECVFSIDGKEYQIAAGEAVFVPANAVHSAYRLSSDSETVFYAAVFSRLLLADSADTISEKYISPVMGGEMIINAIYSRSVPWQSNVIDLLIEILSLYDYTPYDNDPLPSRHPELYLRSDTICPEITIKADMLKIWGYLVSHAATGEKRRGIEKVNHERIQNAIRFINCHYSEPLTLETIASEVYMGREYFSRVFKSCTGLSPFEYLTGYRISRSMELLEQTDLKVIEIAAQCGFTQVNHFNRKFAQAAGCTPSEYRKGRFKLLQSKDI